ncbi:bilirubin oxidase [Gallibacterium salpingitidis]|uniref:Bilirubin oxidase n=1 Tax=Gallibacterium salpingitidis TaxID=505341 RepID=A0AB36E0X5_9PAST|nr:multicopper oxidase family protein [Gallibacterium salpingitidis]OBX06508.1 bilirubin oxidase [Gallibacterium salpingitidis]OBX08865.1 bilirubin oxidase [Gallibacterium salpingitidis]
MKRRDLLRYGVGLSLASSSFYALANMMNSHSAHQTMMAMHNNTLALMPFDQLPQGQSLQTALPKLANLSTQDNVFKAKLVAAPIKLRFAEGKETEFWAYNGQLPGPQIEVFEGDSVEIEFTNHLTQPTTIHWHGLDVPSEADGNPQDPVAPNSSKIYRFTIPEGSAGTYWYHPHPHGYVAEQVYKGLAGTLVVKAKNDPLADLPEQHWVISDLRLAADGSIPANNMSDWMNGREGEIVLINGQYQPKIQVKGQQRIRIWNATSARYLRLKVAGVQWIVVGTEGGLLEQPLSPQDELFLAPAERIEVVMVGKTQGTAILQSLYYERHKMMVQETAADLTLAQIAVNAEQPTLPKQLRIFPTKEEAKVTRQIRFSEQMMNHNGMSSQDHQQMMAQHHSTHQQAMIDNPVPTMMEGMFLINNKSFDMSRIDFVGKVNEVEQWEIFNESHMDHPFHLHGTQFEVIQTTLNGKTHPAPYRALKDVVNLRPYEKVVIRFKQHHTGLKMFHCHILEHENLGMMGQFKVE